MLFIRDIYLSPEQEDHIWTKHHVTPEEVNEVCFGTPVDRRGREGTVQVFGRTNAGRYLFVIIVPLGQGDYEVVTARNMETGERRYYQARMR
ncbi:MAG: BrnT family toxin [Chloroflexi bacterium]|nr:BrnT family toxin [Chloroflexota bacterium]